MRKFLLLAMLMAFLCQFASAQISLAGKDFNFPNGAKEWSDPITKMLSSVKMDDKGIPQVPLEFRIKVDKKVILACHYLVEVKNTSTNQGIKFAVYNDYTDASGNRIHHKVKLKPGETATFKIIYSQLGCKVKEAEDCPNCGWQFHFEDIYTL